MTISHIVVLVLALLAGAYIQAKYPAVVSKATFGMVA